MKIEFKNGSSIESIGVELENKRGRRAFLKIYEDINIHWYQRLWLEIYCIWYGFLQKVGLRR